VGPLAGKTIKLWYDASHTGKNRRATKLMGFPIAGDVLVVLEDGNLSEADFLAAEKLIVNE
jgi:hypothetical protein